jgi:hypothetical protein
MFGFVSRLFSRPQAEARGRRIFRYIVAGQAVFADPMVIAQKLETIGGENWADLVGQVDRLRRPVHGDEAAVNGREWLNKRNADFKAALADLVRIVRQVFDLQPLAPDGAGVTDHEAIEVLAAYILFSRELAAAARPL